MKRLIIAGLLASTTALAAEYPDKTIVFVVQIGRAHV